MPEKQAKQIHKVTYVGSYNPGNKPYRITLDVPEDIVESQNVIGWFKREMHDGKSKNHKLFIQEHPEFERLATHSIENLEEVETVRNG
jgi:hypothetical protein